MNTNSAKNTIQNSNDTADMAGSGHQASTNPKVSGDLKAEKLAYVLDMLEELRKLSATIDEPMVAYLIEMAILETNTAINVQEFGTELGSRSRKNRDGF